MNKEPTTLQGQNQQRQRITNLLKIAVTIAGLLFVVARFNLREVGTALAAVANTNGLFWLFVALSLIGTSLVVRAYRWFVVMRGSGARVRFGRLVELYIIGNFFNAVLPSGFGGDIVRVTEMTQEIPAGMATGTVIIDRLTGLLTLFAMALVALPFRPANFPADLLGVISTICVVGLVGGLCLLHPSIAGLLLRRLPPRLPLPFQTFLNSLLRTIAGCGSRRILAAIAISVIFNLMQILWWAAAARALNFNNVPLGYLLLVIPVFAIALLIPSIGGLGVRETLAPALLAAVLLPEQAIALSLLVFLLERAASLLGGPVYLYKLWRDSRHSSNSKESLIS